MSAIDAEEANALAYSLEIPGNPSIYIGWWQVNDGGIGRKPGSAWERQVSCKQSLATSPKTAVIVSTCVVMKT
ncbi:hypothetical protein MCOR02_001994 [Pyricularia oryzae]|uniref:Uncharacterized protein n=2 Tax=Pyricularia oryzae TaxID=318829 RepID=G4MX13_PYRO7|nr:uncharacterized protein MGG_15644 [Pyricularia oryzae 70-15]KAH9438360.1 hypothetical protein MCOR02_001994 [Pyricularia oryzae]EHA54305.1 hypothetical protein MGG_15644 [Pyricularia oryzae 70-15]KAI6254771.1 hypothetical protein MCOR19_008735 [Pyricularia oryzae]KAI6317943.1 hypothetical protein MCOR34_003838 [Pyricularia oryzae]KAI6358771.1 hypothetical protein MCOR32_009449 [Pyricularia oryzae]